MPPFLSSPDALRAHVDRQLSYLYTARPTAVNLGEATRRLTRVLNAEIEAGKDARAVAEELVKVGRQVADEDVGRNREMSRLGAEWLQEETKRRGTSQDGASLNVMTVCNTGSLATSVRVSLDFLEGDRLILLR